MKIVLHIEGDDQDEGIRRVLAAISGNAPTITTATTGAVFPHGGSAPTPPAPFLPTNQADDDDDQSGAPSFNATDSAGLPWDERIHAATRTTKADGTWKRKKGVSAEAAAPIEAELRGNVPTAAPTPPAMPIPLPSAPQPLPTAPVSAPSMPPIGMPPMPANTAPQPAQDSGETLNFGQFMAKLTGIMGSGQADVAFLQSVASSLGLAAITDLASKPDMIPAAVGMFMSAGKWN